MKFAGLADFASINKQPQFFAQKFKGTVCRTGLSVEHLNSRLFTRLGDLCRNLSKSHQSVVHEAGQNPLLGQCGSLNGLGG